MSSKSQTKNMKLSSIQLQLLNDEFFLKESSEITKKLIDLNMNINTISAVIKEYTVKYAYIKEKAPELASMFTSEMWWRSRGV